MRATSFQGGKKWKSAKKMGKVDNERIEWAISEEKMSNE